ncbi:sensor histidine kinase [Clostridium chrysemydis]|uniref:sensor histidine kinase n=1 Tax=Clostridium chrysemydis TaxID=2665504 RepID=UPI001883D7FC|nr:ATP-binding protein [Clostridium chrysemydis]
MDILWRWIKIKINKKISLVVSLVIICVLGFSTLINTIFVSKYYIYEKSKIINKVYENISKLTLKETIDDIKFLEDKYGVKIAYTKYTKNIDNVNENIKDQFFNKGIKLNKFWITEDTLLKSKEDKVNKIYYQNESKYKVFASIFLKEDYIFVIGVPMEFVNETLGIVNKFNIILLIVSIVIITILIYFFSKRLVKPLENLKDLAKDISNLNFRKEEIKTGDEIEELSIAINTMSENLESANKKINDKNEMLKGVISGISHEFKTPLSLIKIYGRGIKDGLDDGTYLDTIEEEADDLNNLVNELLVWAKTETKELELKSLNLEEILLETLNKYSVLIKESNIEIYKDIETLNIIGDKALINLLLSNLVSNSIKYTDNNKIEIKIDKDKKVFKIRNGNREKVSNTDDLIKPFYVINKSRNKELSGTGLGLTIVNNICKAHEFKLEINSKDNYIEFNIYFDGCNSSVTKGR